MPSVIAEIEEKFRSLSAEDKAELIRSLIAELDGPADADAERAWLDEARRRHGELAEGKTHPDAKAVSTVEKLMMKAWRLSVSSPAMLSIANRLGRLVQWPLLRRGRLTRLPPPLSGWTRHRTFPRVSSTPFRQRWRRYLEAERDAHE